MTNLAFEGPSNQTNTTFIQQQAPNDQEPLHLFYAKGIRYVAVPCSQFECPDAFDGLFTIIDVEESKCITEKWLRQTVELYRSADDVFCDDFLHGVIFAHDTWEARVSPDGIEYLKSLGTSWVRFMKASAALGPYYKSRGRTCDVYRLYDDTQGAFFAGLLCNKDFQCYNLAIGGKTSQTLAVAVPSRLRHLGANKHEAPFAGLRIAVKDNFAIQGIKTSLCNRAYHDIYPAATETAGCIKLLGERGAVIVGTTKLASFAATEEPLECIDYQAPWNPRADGHQSPAGSSSGSGVAIASYPWLDIAIGSDTSGSGRRPGHWNGCYAMRPSHGILPVDGYVASFRRFDVPTFFSREVAMCRTFAKSWYGNMLPVGKKALPSRIIYPLDYMNLITNADQLRSITKFVAKLETYMGIEHEKVSLTSLWKTSPPKEAKEHSLDDYMERACRDAFFYDDYHNFDRFRHDYKNRFIKEPYVSPPVRRQWKTSAQISRPARDRAVKRLEVYCSWFCNTVMREQYNNSIVILPVENILPRYRDSAKTNFDPIGVPMLFLSPIIRGPEFTVPIDQVHFSSRVSGLDEYLPVTVSLLGSWGRDIELIDLVQGFLSATGYPTSVSTGRMLFNG
ncbi:MAG: hypothetical protein Q9220_002930 [cf. Caloplaca sp. 1 TL-2023]